MKRFNILLGCLLLLLLPVMFVFGFESSITVSLISNGLIIGTPNNLDLGTVLPANIIEKTFGDYFWIEDLRGFNTGHYTTIQCDGLYGPSNTVITGVQLSGANVERLLGSANNTLIYSNLTSWTDITTPQLYLYRNDVVGSNGLINRYGNKPSIKITVPAGVPSGSYKGKITYTLYDYGIDF